METLKKFFPLSFKRLDSVGSLIVGILLYLVVGIVAGALIWLATFLTIWIPLVGGLVGWVLGIAGALVDIYVLAGIVIQILAYCKVLKD